jgi:hypothetical protein
LEGGKSIAEIPYLQKNAADMLDQLAWWTQALKAARERPSASVAA